MLTIDHIQIAAPSGSEDRLRAFYVDLLGLREIAKPAALVARGGLWLEAGNMQLHIGIDTPAPVNAASKRHVAFSVTDLATMRAKLERAAVAIEEDGAPIQGCTRFYVRDPVGNRIEFVELIKPG